MAKLKLLSWKTLLIILSIILVPFIISLIANCITSLRFKDRVEITLQLDSWITMGTLLESDIPNLKMTYGDKPINNALKISWRIVNTGSKGISEFEKRPTLVYPEKLDIVKAKISQTSPLLIIDKNPSINPEYRTIEVNNIGIFNPGDFFKIDIYIMDIPESIIPTAYFTNWELIAKSTDLKLKKSVILQETEEVTPFILSLPYISLLILSLSSAFICIVALILMLLLEKK